MSPKKPASSKDTPGTSPIDLAENIRFLINSYSNTQRVIQFCDTKAGAYVAFTGIMASLIANNIVKVLSELSLKSSVISKYFLVILVDLGAFLFLCLAALVFYQSLLVLIPRKGPDLVDKDKATKGLFWAGNIVEYLRSHSLDQYSNTILNLTQGDMVTELSYETAKLAQITNTKLKHLGKATSLFRWSINVWAVLLLGVSILGILLPSLL